MKQGKTYEAGQESDERTCSTDSKEIETHQAMRSRTHMRTKKNNHFLWGLGALGIIYFLYRRKNTPSVSVDDSGVIEGGSNSALPSITKIEFQRPATWNPVDKLSLDTHLHKPNMVEAFEMPLASGDKAYAVFMANKPIDGLYSGISAVSSGDCGYSVSNIKLGSSSVNLIDISGNGDGKARMICDKTKQGVPTQHIALLHCKPFPTMNTSAGVGLVPGGEQQPGKGFTSIVSIVIVGPAKKLGSALEQVKAVMASLKVYLSDGKSYTI